MATAMDSILDNLKENLPCRNDQIEELYNLFAYKDEPFVDNVYIYGGPSTGKSIVVTSLLNKLQITHAIVNLVECYTPKILYEIILNQFSGHKMDPKNPVPYAKCDNIMEFIFYLRKISEELNLNQSILVLDRAEELRQMDLNILLAFLKLKEISKISITVIFISQILFEKYSNDRTVALPWKIHFPQYNKDELLEILALDFSYARNLINNDSDELCNITIDFYKNYLNLFLSVFYRACRDVTELKHMSRINFLKYCQPIMNKEQTVTDSMALWRNIAPILKASLEVLYLRIDVTSNGEQAKMVTDTKQLAQSMELPYYAKYLLIAAYLASYNSTKDDKRLFMKHHGKKTKTKRDVKLKSKVSEQLNTQLGPKPFSFDRLLAIFYSILDDKIGFNNNLLVQVSSLVELRLLSTTSDHLSLDGQQYKCNVNFDFIHGISRMLGFNIRKYLSDFSHI